MIMERDFKGIWIPAEVWLDDRLGALDKMILAEIDSLDNGIDGCWASNDYLARFCQCSPRKVSDSVSNLIKCGYIVVKSFDGRNRVLRSCMAKDASESSKNCESDTQNLRESILIENTNRDTDSAKPTSGSRKCAVKTDAETLIMEYTGNEELRQTLREFMKMRNAIKKPMTPYAVKLLLKKLTTLASDPAGQMEILEQSITHNWQGIFPAHNYGTDRIKLGFSESTQDVSLDDLF